MDERWQSIIDRAIREAVGDGNMANAPGAGKPLKLDEDSHTPPEMRMAFKIMRENDLKPDWILETKELDALREKLLVELRAAANAYSGQLGDARRTDDAARHERAEGAWKRALEAFRSGAQAYNKRVLTCNLKLPRGVNQKSPIEIEREIATVVRR